MFKQALLLSVAAAGLLLTGLASADSRYESNDWEQPEYHGNPGGHFSIHVVPPPHYYRPAPPPPPRCVPGYRVDEMQAEQASRIHAGRQDGDLTRPEMDSLFAQQNHIAALEGRMRNDGCLTLHERNDLIARLDQASRDIWRERNDNERRGQHHRPHYGGWSSDRN